jgi:hypothetical protein
LLSDEALAAMVLFLVALRYSTGIGGFDNKP